MKHLSVKLNLDEESRLLEGCLAGDMGAINRFAAQYAPLIFTFMRKTFIKKGYYDRLGNSDIEREKALEEFYQEFFIKKFAKDDFYILRKFNHSKGASLATWIRTVTINFTKDHISKETRKARSTPVHVSIDQPIGDSEQTLGGTIPSAGEDALNEIIGREEILSIKAAIEGLGGIKKEIITLLFIEGYDPGEIAEKLGVSIDTVYSRKSEAIKKLREKLKKSVSF